MLLNSPPSLSFFLLYKQHNKHILLFFGTMTSHSDKKITNDMINGRDVILGRGSGAAIREGNRRYRDILRDTYQQYVSSLSNTTTGIPTDPSLLGSADKKVIATRVLYSITSQGGRFLSCASCNSFKKKPISARNKERLRIRDENDVTTYYEEISDKDAVITIKNALRFQLRPGNSEHPTHTVSSSSVTSSTSGGTSQQEQRQLQVDARTKALPPQAPSFFVPDVTLLLLSALSNSGNLQQTPQHGLQHQLLGSTTRTPTTSNGTAPSITATTSSLTSPLLSTAIDNDHPDVVAAMIRAIEQQQQEAQLQFQLLVQQFQQQQQQSQHPSSRQESATISALAAFMSSSAANGVPSSSTQSKEELVNRLMLRQLNDDQLRLLAHCHYSFGQ
jgi:hypothetical protein